MFNSDFKFLFHIVCIRLYSMHRHSNSDASTCGGVPSGMHGDPSNKKSIRESLTENDEANILLLGGTGCMLRRQQLRDEWEKGLE